MDFERSLSIAQLPQEVQMIEVAKRRTYIDSKVMQLERKLHEKDEIILKNEE
jgi:hypothetical protein